MAWTDHDNEKVDLMTATADETLLLALSTTDPRRAEELVVHLDRHADQIVSRINGRGRMEVLRAETPQSWMFGPFGFIGPLGALAFAIAIAITMALQLSFPHFAIMIVGAYLFMRLLMLKPDRRDWFAVGTPLGAGVVAAWMIRRVGSAAPVRCDDYLGRALVAGPEYWHDLAAQAISSLPLSRREHLVLPAFDQRPDALWHLLPHVPTRASVEAALRRGPRSSATAEFHAFGTLLRQATVEPVLEAIRRGVPNRDLLIRAIATSGNPAAADVLVMTLSERNERLRDVARDGLIALGPPVLPKLFSAFEHADRWVQQGVSRALRGMRPDAQIDSFCEAQLGRARIDEVAATDLRRIMLSYRVLQRGLRFDKANIKRIDSVLASIPAPESAIEPLAWADGTQMTAGAMRCLIDMLRTEGPQTRCAELAGLRRLIAPGSVVTLDRWARTQATHPIYRMVLAEDAALLAHHYERTGERADTEIWIDVLERHASLAAVHALDELWQTGLDGVVQTAAMAALMRLSGAYDGLETFADRALFEVLREPDHLLYDAFARGQFRRFERMMVSARRVTEDEFAELYMTVPAQSVLWGYYDNRGSLTGAFRIDEEGIFVDADDVLLEIPPDHVIGIAHPAELGATACGTWAQVFTDYELVPHFEQLHRPARRLKQSEAAQTLFTDFETTAPGGPLERLLIQRGWRPSPTDIEKVYTMTKPVQRGSATYTAVIETSPGFGEDPAERQTVDCLAFWKGHHHVFSHVVQKIPLHTVDAVVFSEVVLELRQILAASTVTGDVSVPAIETGSSSMS